MAMPLGRRPEGRSQTKPRFLTEPPDKGAIGAEACRRATPRRSSALCGTKRAQFLTYLHRIETLPRLRFKKRSTVPTTNKQHAPPSPLPKPKPTQARIMCRDGPAGAGNATIFDSDKRSSTRRHCA